MTENTNYTQRLNSIKSELDESFVFYTKQDVKNKLEEIYSANEEGSFSALSSLEDELLQMLKYVLKEKTELEPRLITNCDNDSMLEEIKAENKNKIKEYLVELKTVGLLNLDKLFLSSFNSLIAEYKSSKDYMERLVARLLRTKGHDENEIENTPTRVLILKQFINAFGYDAVESLATPELEEIVKSKYGTVENIKDDIFDYVQFDNIKKEASSTVDICETAEAITDFLAILRYKATTTRLSLGALKLICEVFEDEVLTPQAKNKEAYYLKDCFVNPDEIDANSFKIEKLNSLIELNKLLKSSHTAGIKEDDRQEELRRLLVLLSVFRKKFPYKDVKKRLRTVFPVFIGRDTLRLKEVKTVIDTKEVDEEGLEVIREILPVAEACLNDEERRAYEMLSTNVEIEDIDELFRIVTVFSKFSKDIPFDDVEEELSTVFPFLKDAKEITEEHIDKVARTQRNSITNDMRDTLKKLLPRIENKIEAKVEYRNEIYDLIKRRANGAIRKNERNGIYEKSLNLLKTKTCEFKLLRIANELANASFTENQSIREKLYIFAIAFGMKANSFDGKQDPSYGDIYDIEKNLFTDYYCDNIVNSLLDDKNNFVVSGRAINYKNFAEMAYLWCANKTDWSAKEKLINANKIIEECSANGKNEREFYKQKKELSTIRCKENMLQAELASTQDVVEYLLNNYPCKSKGNPFKICSASQSAGKIINEQYQLVDKLYKYEFVQNGSIENPEGQSNFKKSFYELETLCDDEQKLLKQALKRVGERIYGYEKNNRSNSRTEILVLSFYEIVLAQLIEEDQSDKPRKYVSFADYFDMFCNGAQFLFEEEEDEEKHYQYNYTGCNKRLEEAGFQTVNSKNLFDICLIFVAYKNNTNRIFNFSDEYDDMLINEAKEINELSNNTKS